MCVLNVNIELILGLLYKGDLKQKHFSFLENNSANNIFKYSSLYKENVSVTCGNLVYEVQKCHFFALSDTITIQNCKTCKHKQ